MASRIVRSLMDVRRASVSCDGQQRPASSA